MDFPTDVAEFDNDPRISFSRLDNSFLLETSDGREFLFNNILKRWVETIDEALIRKQQGYGSDDGDTEIVHPRDRKKRKSSHDENDESKAKKPRVNTAVWVTNIPVDAELSEIQELFVKYGILAEELDTGKPRIKMYTDENGNFKGEALIVYFRPESVNLAIQCLDETDFRMGARYRTPKMRVQAADFSYKRLKDVPPKATLTMKEKQKLKERADRLNKKLSDWGDDEAEEAMKALNAAQEARRHVVLKHMFTLEELNDDPFASSDIQQDIESECSKIGEVTKVVVWNGEMEGVVTVRFVSSADARRCVQTMNGRFFGGRTVVAYIWDGEEKFHKYKRRRNSGLSSGLDTDEEEAERLERFGDWLERGQNKPDKTKAQKDQNEESNTTNDNIDNDNADKEDTGNDKNNESNTNKDETNKSQETGKN